MWVEINIQIDFNITIKVNGSGQECPLHMGVA
jgi:hypothetical protein